MKTTGAVLVLFIVAGTLAAQTPKPPRRGALLGPAIPELDTTSFYRWWPAGIADSGALLDPRPVGTVVRQMRIRELPEFATRRIAPPDSFVGPAYRQVELDRNAAHVLVLLVPTDSAVSGEEASYAQCARNTTLLVAVPYGFNRLTRRWTATRLGLNPYCTRAAQPEASTLRMYWMPGQGIPFVEVTRRDGTCRRMTLFRFSDGQGRYVINREGSSGCE